jgi:GT2 family glycosyltransferase
VLFIDNNSTDGSAKYVMERFSDSRLKVIRLEKNYGYAGATNRGIEIARGDLIAILNNDVIVERSWLKCLIFALLSDKETKAKIATPKILMLENPNKIASCGGEMNVLLVGWDRGLLEDDRGQFKSCSYCFHPAGAAFVMSRELVNELGTLFDNDYFAYFEDVDLGWRTCLLGYKIIYVPQSVVYHKCGGSFSSVSPLKFYLMRRNALYSGIKNFETRIVLVLLPIWLLSSLYASYIFSKATKDSRYIKMGFKVFFDVIRGFRRNWIKRCFIKRQFSSRELLFSHELLTYKPSMFDRALVRIINGILRLIGFPNLGINSMREYPTFTLLKAHAGERL